MIGLLAAEGWVAGVIFGGLAYALWIDTKSTLPRGSWRRLL